MAPNTCQGPNTLAYYEYMLITSVTSLVTLAPVANIIKLFLGVIYATSGVFPYDFN